MLGQTLNVLAIDDIELAPADSSACPSSDSEIDGLISLFFDAISAACSARAQWRGGA